MGQPPKDSAADQAWVEEIAEVTPLGGSKPVKKPFKDKALVEPLMTTPDPTEWGPVVQPPLEPLVIVSNTSQRIAGHMRGMEPKLFKDLSLGKVAVSAHLDLHGWREADGWPMVLNWLHEASIRNHRCVLLVVGKGKGYGELRDMGIFRSQIAQVLAFHPLVMAFHTALPGDGGAGALYVYFRKYT